MRYLGEHELTQVMGIGRYGEVREGPDGRLYQWVQGVDGLGKPIGFGAGCAPAAQRCATGDAARADRGVLCAWRGAGGGRRRARGNSVRPAGSHSRSTTDSARSISLPTARSIKCRDLPKTRSCGVLAKTN